VLSQAVSMMGKVNLPVIPFLGSELAMAALDRVVAIGFSPHLTRLLRYGRVVDTTALSERLGEVVRHSTLDAVLAHARTRRVRDLVDPSHEYEYEAELEDFLRSRRTSSSNGHARPVPARRARRTARPRPSRTER
jgi:hypothetical protein